MRRYKKIIAPIVVVLLLVGLGIYVGTDKGAQRVILVTAIEAWTGGTFQIEGDVSFSMGRLLSVSAEQVTFALPRSGSSGTVGRIRVSIDTLSAVEGPLIIDELHVEQGQIRVDGPPASENAPASAADGGVNLPIVQRIEIMDTRLDLSVANRDDYSTITIDKLAVLQLDDRRELEIAGEGFFDDIPLALTGGIGPFEELQNAAVNAPIRLTFSSSGGRVAAVGTIFDVFRDAQLDVAVTANGFSGDLLDRMAKSLELQNTQLIFAGNVFGPISRPQIADMEAGIEADGVTLELTGQIGDPAYGGGIDLQFKGSVGGDYLRHVITDLPKSLGLEQIDASGHVRGSLTRIDLSGFDVIGQLAGQARFSASGQVTLMDALRDLNVTEADLALQLTAPTTQLLGDLIDDNLNNVGTIEGGAHLAGSNGTVALERISLLAGRDGPVRLRITGRIPWRLGNLAESLEAAELLGELTGDDVKDLTPLLGIDMPSVGAIKLSTAIRPSGEDVNLTDVTIEISGSDDLQITATGGARIQDVAGESFLDSIDAAVKATSSTSTAFLQIFDVNLPELGPTAGTAQVTGNEDRLSVRSIDIRTIEAKALNVGMTGRINQIDLINDGKVSDLDLNVTLAAAKVASIEQLADVNLPDLGPVRATARLQDRDKGSKLAVETFSASVGPEGGPVLSITGDFDNVLKPQMGVMKATVRVDSVKLSEAMNWPSIAGLKTIAADMEVTARDGSLGIERMTMASADSDAISLTARGAIDDLLNFDQVDLDIVVNAPDAAIFDPALQGVMRPVGALDIEGKFIVAKPDMRFAGGMRLGSSDIDTTLNVSTAGERPNLTGQISAKRLELDDFGIDSPRSGSQEPASGDNSEKQRDYVFTKDPLPFKNLFAADLDLTITADGGQGLGESFDALQAQIRLQDGRLSLDPFKVAYDGGNVEVTGMIDASVVPPAVNLRLRGTDFELGELLLYVQAEPTAAGDLTGEFNLQSRGSSPRELAENLSGTADLALENGRVNGINLHVLSNETLEYLFSLPNLSQSTELRCAIARFQIEAGVAKSQALLIATPRMTLSGAGGIDFGGEKLDITVSADPKSFAPVIFKKPVRIHGEFLDLDYSTGGATPGLLGGLFGTVAGFVAAPFVFAPVSAAGSLAGLLLESGTESPCLIDEKPPRN